MSSETDDNPMLSVIQEEINLFSESSEWKRLFEFEDMISDSSNND